MNATSYSRANRFIDRVSVAQAAVEWQGLTAEQELLVVVNDGMPFLAGVPDLADRAAAVLDAAQRGLIRGLVQNEDGYPLRPDAMRLDRKSVREFIDSVDVQPQPLVSAGGGDVMLRLEEVAHRLGVSKQTVYRRIADGKLERPHLLDPSRWRKSYVDALVAGTADDEI